MMINVHLSHSQLCLELFVSLVDPHVGVGGDDGWGVLGVVVQEVVELSGHSLGSADALGFLGVASAGFVGAEDHGFGKDVARGGPGGTVQSEDIADIVRGGHLGEVEHGLGVKLFCCVAGAADFSLWSGLPDNYNVLIYFYISIFIKNYWILDNWI